MKHIKQGPVIRQDEQLVVIVEQALVNEAKFYGRHQPKIWRGVLEAERREFMTYRAVADFALDNPDVKIIKALRVDMSEGKVEDITEDVLDSLAPQDTRSVMWPQVYNPVKQVAGARI